MKWKAHRKYQQKMLTVYQVCTWDPFALSPLKRKISDKDDPPILKECNTYLVLIQYWNVFKLLAHNCLLQLTYSTFPYY